MALRLYRLRKQYGSSPAVAAELDRVFNNIVSGATGTASWQLSGLESRNSVIYNLSHDGAQLQFSIGGFVASGAQVQVSSNLTNWRPVQSFGAGTNLTVFSTKLAQTACLFFRVE